jgi:hypothetical protein
LAGAVSSTAAGGDYNAPRRITRFSQEVVMANKDQSKSKAKTNAPKLTAKQKKEKKAKKAAARDAQQ